MSGLKVPFLAFLAVSAMFGLAAYEKAEAGGILASATESDSPSDLLGDAGQNLETNQSEIETVIQNEVDRRRVAHGMREYNSRRELKEVARYHSENMDEMGFVNHTSPAGETLENRYGNNSIYCDYTGEVITQTWMYTPIRTEDGTIKHMNEKQLAEGVVDGWMESDSHRAVILSHKLQFSGVGVSVNWGPKERTEVYVTLNFCGSR